MTPYFITYSLQIITRPEAKSVSNSLTRVISILFFDITSLGNFTHFYCFSTLFK